MPPLQHCFDPVVRGDTRLIVLGSLPGARSLEQGRYYAHPQNHFWRLIGAVIERDLASKPYADRLEMLLDARVGLWDMVAAATRRGSLDSDIRLQRASDFGDLLVLAPGLRALAFNGATAARLGRAQADKVGGVAMIDLPSSSPAYAIGFDRKLERWINLRPYL